MENYRKGDILTIWLTIDGQRIDKQRVVILNIVRTGLKGMNRYKLKSLDKKRPHSFYWTDQQMDRNAELFMPASELASILYK